MILTKLFELYERLEQDPEFDNVLPRSGTSKQKMSFLVVLTPDGNLFDIQDAKIETIEKGKNGKEKKTTVTRDLIVPGGAHPSGTAATPRLLWDNTAYIFGYYTKKAKKEDKDKEKARNILFQEYRKYHHKFRDRYNIRDTGLDAVIAFLDSWNPENIPKDIREKLEKYGDNFGTFTIQGKKGYIFDSPVIREAYQQMSMKGDSCTPHGTCLITGQTDVPIVATVETKVKLAGTSVGGGAIATFNAVAYESYGKKQTYNSPLSEIGAFKAYNALNLLIADSRYNFKLADTTVVFWTGKKTQTENLLAWIVNNPPSDDKTAMDISLTQRLQKFWQIVSEAGDPDLTSLGDDVSTPFYMLGIEPNAARIVIRFWYESSLGDFILRLRDHIQNLALQKSFSNEYDHIPIWLLLAQTARETKDIPKLLPASLLRSILEGLPYPTSLYQLTLNRINLGHDTYKVGSKVSYYQASIIKAYLTRNVKQKGLTMSLNQDNKKPAYLLGRLFATLEMTQNDASGGVNAGIGDKFYSAAASTPRIVFPTLLDLFRKWIKKLSSDKPGLAIVREKLVGEILDDMDSTKGFPSQLSMEDRGLFAFGYYQQIRVFFSKKNEEDIPVSNQ